MNNLFTTPAQPVEIREIWAALPRRYTVQVIENEYARPSYAGDRFNAWDASIACGKSYLVGDTWTMPQYLKRYTSPLTPWMRVAYQWALQHPGQRLEIEGPRYIYYVSKHGEYVEIGLPHQDHGGERHWITRDGIHRVLINED